MWAASQAGAQSGDVYLTSALAADATGNLYVASGNVQKRDAQGKWSVITMPGPDLGQVDFGLGTALVVDTAGNLYVVDSANSHVRKYTPGP